MALQGKRVLLIVGGGVAAYKALELTRLLRKAEILVRPILTRAGARFVTPLSLAALAEDQVYQELFSLTDEAQMGHIELSRSADLIVVAPATADLMAKAAAGLADDLASTTLLATDARVLMAPSMNVRMWEHPATRANVETLKSRGVGFVGPGEGAMACGEFGFGRLAEPTDILDAIRAALGEEAGQPLAGQPLAGKRVLVTAGPTVEPIDPVRVLTNRSSGKQGYAIASSLQRLGAEVTLVSGPTALEAPQGVRRVLVETAEQMLQACQAALPVKAAVLVAAVADWRPAEAQARKIKKTGAAAQTLVLTQTPDTLAVLSRPVPQRPALVVGFAAETNDLEVNARAKRLRKGCDWIVANDVSQEGVMGGDINTVLLVTAEGAEPWPRASKQEIAKRLADRIAAAVG